MRFILYLEMKQVQYFFYEPRSIAAMNYRINEHGYFFVTGGRISINLGCHARFKDSIP